MKLIKFDSNTYINADHILSITHDNDSVILLIGDVRYYACFSEDIIKSAFKNIINALQDGNIDVLSLFSWDVKK